MQANYLLTALVLITLASTASAATYYLDAVKGDDANPGTSEAPWKTLDRAYTRYSGTGPKVQEGDTVLFRDGDYGSFSESNINRADWVTYKADTGHKPTLTSIGINNGNQNSYLVFDGFNVTNGVSLRSTSYVKVLNSTIQRQSAASVVGYYAPYIIHRSMAIYGDYADYITIQGNDISNVYRGIQLYGGSRCSNWLIKNNVFHRVAEDGMSLPTLDNSIVEGNYFYDHRRFATATPIIGTKTGEFIPGEVVTMPGTDATGIVYRYKSPYLYAYPTSETTFYTYWWQDKSRYIVGQDSGATMNPISDVDPPHTDGFSMHGSSTNVIIRGNIIDRTRYVGRGSENGQGFKISGISSNITLENNLVIAHNIIIYGVTGLRVYNNTLYVRNGFELRDLKGDVIVTEMYNNIIEKLGIIDEAGKTLQIVNHGNNIFGNNPSSIIDPSTELGNYPVGSLFVDPANKDFHLAPGSIAIDFGSAEHAPATDIEGNPRDTLPDAGAYEFQAATPCTSDSDCDALDSLPCRDYVCNIGGTDTCILADTDGINCNDNDACTDNDACLGGVCQGTAMNCDDGKACTDDSCSAGACQNTANDNLCPADTQCANHYCDAALGCQVTYSPTETPCDDGIACTEGDSCDAAGNCLAGMPNDSKCLESFPQCTSATCHLSQGCINYQPEGCNISPALVSWFRFEGNTLDETGANNGTFQGGTPSYVQGKVGQAMQFDGVDDYVTIPAAVVSGTPFTVCAWVKLNELPSLKGEEFVIASIHTGAGSNNWWNLRADDASNAVQFNMRDTKNTESSQTTATVTPGVWQHYCGVAAADDDRKVYLNAGNLGTSTVSKTPTGFNTTYLGAIYVDAAGGNTDFTNGTIDEIKIYNRALTSEEILALYNETEPGCVDTPALLNYIGQWKQGQITMLVLMQKIALWKAGC